MGRNDNWVDDYVSRSVERYGEFAGDDGEIAFDSADTRYGSESTSFGDHETSDFFDDETGAFQYLNEE